MRKRRFRPPPYPKKAARTGDVSLLLRSRNVTFNRLGAPHLLVETEKRKHSGQEFRYLFIIFRGGQKKRGLEGIASCEICGIRTIRLRNPARPLGFRVCGGVEPFFPSPHTTPRRLTGLQLSGKNSHLYRVSKQFGLPLGNIIHLTQK
jgi:hypothetical protein